MLEELVALVGVDCLTGNLPRPIGSGGPFAKAAATALIENTKLGAKEIAEKAMKIAGQICIYTNETISYEELG